MKEFASGLVVGKLAPLHRGHQRLIETARQSCGRVVVMLWSSPDFPEMPTEVRAEWVRQLYPDVTVVAFAEGEAPPNDAPGETHRQFVRENLPFPVAAVFTGGEDYGPGLAEALGARHIVVDRREDGLAGRDLRGDPLSKRQALHPLVRGHFVEKVVLLGAESSGKSTLGRALAEATGEPYVEEVGRTLWVEAGGDLPLAEYVTICRQHVALENEAVARAQRFAFVDTNAITTQQYAFFFFGECPRAVQAYADRCASRYAHTFVCAPDIPFEQDGTRVHPQVQRYMDGAIRNDLTLRDIPYTVVVGGLAERVDAVLDRIGWR